MVCFEWLGAFCAILTWVDRNFADGRPVLGDKSEIRLPGVRACAQYCGNYLWSLEGINPWPILTVVLRYWTRTRTPP